MKFGGSSVADAGRIKAAAGRIVARRERGDRVVAVLSARGDTTDELLEMAAEVSATPDPREMDMLLSTGERISCALAAMAISDLGHSAISLTGSQAGIVTDTSHTRARILDVRADRIREALDSDTIVLVAGFQGVSTDRDVTTLGRGGSDTTAVAVAAALGASVCEIYTDVAGVFSADPRIVPDAKKLGTVSFEEMLEMASLGSKVLQIRSVEFAGNYRMPTRVLSSLTDPLMPLEEEAQSGTLISFEEDTHMEQATITGIAFSRDEAKITVRGVPDKPGIAFQILGPVADANIEVDMIVQNISVDGKTDFTFTVPRADYDKSMKLIDSGVKATLGATHVVGDNKVSKVSVVGVGMRSHVGIASQMFRTLSEDGINIQMISTSEIKISVLIDEKYTELAVRALHKAFGLEKA